MQLEVDYFRVAVHHRSPSVERYRTLLKLNAKHRAKRTASDQKTQRVHVNSKHGEKGRKEGNVLFNDALSTFYLRLLWRQTYGRGPFR